MPKLLLKFNAAVIKEVSLEKGSVSVGRKPDNDIVIDNPAISGHHCKVSLEGGTYYVEDLDSTNGTYVNQKRVKKSGLHNNDVVGIAKHSIVFVDAAATEAAEAAVDGDATMMISPEKQAELVAASAAAKDTLGGKTGLLKVLKGVADKTEYELKGA